MVVEPVSTAVTIPSAETVATLSRSLTQVTIASAMEYPLASSATAVSVSLEVIPL